MTVASALFVSGCYSGVFGGGPGVDTFAGDATEGDSDSAGDTDGASDGGEQAAVDCAAEAKWSAEFLDSHCAGCHGAGDDAAGNFDYVTDLTRLVTSQLVVPGDLAASPLFARIEGGAMPPADAPMHPDIDQIDRFADYILSCADTPKGQCGDNQPVVIADQLQMMADDVVLLDDNAQPFTRYLTLTHLYNAGFCDADIEPFRQAIGKLANSLSTQPTIVAPVPIDDHETIFRIDLRDYGWDVEVGAFSNKWEALVDASPYSVERLEQPAETLKLISGSTIPFLSGDSFVEIASQPPLYNVMANIPANLTTLELGLDMNIQGEAAAFEADRAGLLDSAIAQQNRIVQRHQLRAGPDQVFWLCYDFEDDSQKEQNIFVRPLAFEPSGGEVIYSLPNGLHAYMLFDENENRIDVAPDDVVTDPRMEDHNVRNGISCFGCHDEIIQTSDAVRDYVAQSTDFDVQTKEAVQKLYASKSAMNALQEQDTEVLRNAYVAAGVDVASPIEPVSESFTRFRLNVDLQRAAAELGVTPTALSSQLGALDPALGLLATGSVKRDVWTTLFAETACLLNVGLTDDPACSASEDTDSDTESGLDADTAYADCANNPSDICGVDSLCLHPAYSSVSVCAPQPCEYDADCPEAPASGDAHVRCDYVPEGESKSCFLDCSAGQTCPDGMVCAEETVCMFEQV